MDLNLKVRIIAEGIVLGAATAVNEQPFTALITYAGKPSDHYVGGTEGINGGPYRVLIPKMLLKKRITELAGKRVFASDDLVSHKNVKYVGKFVSAWCDDMDGDLAAGRASGLLMRDADPDLVQEIISEARKGHMGFSYDLKDVRFELKASSDASESQYIELTDFIWRGATILRRDAAAYSETELAAHKAANPKEGEETMDKAEIMTAVREGMQASFTDFKKDTIDPLRTELTSQLTAVKTEVEGLKGKQATLEAAIATGKPAEKPAGQPAEKQAPAPGTRILATDFAASISEGIKSAMTEVVKPLQEAVAELKAAVGKAKEEPPNTRKTLDAAGIQVLQKYSDFDGKSEPTLENVQASINMIQSDARLTKEAKGSLLRDMGAYKRQLMRAASTAQGGA